MTFMKGQPMKPEAKSYHLLGVTRSKAKMFEYSVPTEHHIAIPQNPAPSELFTLAIGLLGDMAAAINRDGVESETLLELKNHRQFSAHFFDSYRESELTKNIDPYLILMGAASYYLCDIPGSAMVLAERIEDYPDLEIEGLEDLLLWMLKSNTQIYFEESEGQFGKFINGIHQGLTQFFQNGDGEENLRGWAKQLRKAVYEYGTPRQLLLGDVIAAVVIKKLINSTWNALPLYSELSVEQWRPALQKPEFTKELWPAQHLLGRNGVLAGQSAIVQMPTSAGKTKATELILRSAFLAERTSLAIIIAPFRALCAEIKDSLAKAFEREMTTVNEFTDVLQKDFKIPEIPEIPTGESRVLVTTPEKLVYVLRHNPQLAGRIGLLVFDEGHQFDNGTRGITYELLLTSLRSMINGNTQKVLISAVISNAESVGQWLNGTDTVVKGIGLNSTLRTVGFASWLAPLGQIKYVNNQNADDLTFYVPRVIERLRLSKKGRETTDRFFPDRTGTDIALYLGLKLIHNGGVAIFCGTKIIATSLCKRVVDIIKRNAPLALQPASSNPAEIERLHRLYSANLGSNAPASQSAQYGFFAHHGDTPQGVRLAVEYAMREDLVHFVFCTSTLAQGVNLPIKYLIVSGIQQAEAQIKIRDFQNLMGRAGRAGMHTEGSVLFANPAIYDNPRTTDYEIKNWNNIKKLLDPDNSEPSISSLLSIFDPITNDYNEQPILINILTFTQIYINTPDGITRHVADIIQRARGTGFSLESVMKEIHHRVHLISAVESFLLSHLEETEVGFSEEDIISLAEGTFAFFLAGNTEKKDIRALFKLLAENIVAKIPEENLRKIYGRTLRGIHDAQAIEQWVKTNIDRLLTLDETNALDIVWSLFTEHITEDIFIRFDNLDIRKDIAQGWIDGTSFGVLLEIINARGAKKLVGDAGRTQKFNIEDIVKLCENTLSYHGNMLIGAVCEIIKILERDDTETLTSHLRLFQRRLKYGLPTQTNIAVYELGFADRVICQDLTTTLNLTDHERSFLIMELRQNPDTRRAEAVLDKYPDYFKDILMNL
ncbi:MAG: DEAD/DEAH box helicase [Candidatus Halichondribacter symbioticus]